MTNKENDNQENYNQDNNNNKDYNKEDNNKEDNNKEDNIKEDNNNEHYDNWSISESDMPSALGLVWHRCPNFGQYHAKQKKTTHNSKIALL